MTAQLSMHIAAHGTNNDGEWMAVHRAAWYAVEHKLPSADVITDSACVTAQINNNASANHPKHAAVHDATASLLAQVPRWRVRHVHRERNELADAKATEGQTRDTADEYAHTHAVSSTGKHKGTNDEAAPTV
jgi:ribonuclease HI